MDIQVFTTTAATAGAAISALSGAFATRGRPDFVALHASAALDADGLRSAARDACGALHGATSCLGVMSGEGMCGADGFGAGAFCLWDPDGDYGSAMRPIEGDPAAAAEAAMRAALANAGRMGETPDIVWLSVSPGAEEDVLAGIQRVVGPKTPVLGGSAADNEIAGAWRVFDRDACDADGVVVSALFPSAQISFAYHSGYAPDARSGEITRAEGRRLFEIDDRPAAEVYAEWTDGAIPAPGAEPVSILAESTFSPLGRYLESVNEVPFFLLAHPATLNPDGSLDLFADVEEGDRLTLMHGSPESLTERAGKVAALSVDMAGVAPEAVKGALVVYCGGCMLAVQDRMDEVASGVSEALAGAPFLGVFTFGEQGMALDGRNRHGNLMISCITFTE